MTDSFYEEACKIYSTDLEYLTGQSKKATLCRWKREMGEEKVPIVNRDRLPKYAVDVEKGLVSDITQRISVGLSIDNVVLRNLLLVRLKSTDKLRLLRDNGGKHIFQDCWARRFWKRLINHAVTSKMRDLPLDIEEKKDLYVRIAARYILKY